MRFGGVLKPRNNALNRLVEIVHEADLGEDHELGKTRKHMSEENEMNFSQQGLHDEGLHVLNSKAENTKLEPGCRRSSSGVSSLTVLLISARGKT